MSRCAHEQSTYRLRDLPKCSRCKQQFQLVKARYETKTGKSILVDEWECERCNKTVPFEHLKEGKCHGDEKFFHDKMEQIRKEDARRKNRTTKRSNK